MPNNNKGDDDDIFDKVSEMAERLSLTGADRQKYVHDHMTRAGYNMVPSYVKGDNDDDQEEDFFSRRKAKSKNGGGRNRGDDDRSGGWF
jgi:hypothetical protein